MSYYNQKRAFITGGSAGIGRTTAIELAKQGASVMVCARGQQKLDDTVAAMEAVRVSPDQKFGSFSADVTDHARMQEAASATSELMGGVDLLIANSGYAECRAVADADAEHFRRLMDVNYFGHVNTVQAFLPQFVERGSGDIVMVSSMLAMLSVWGYAGYSASKFAIRGFSEALRQEMGLHNVKVKLFLPPTTDTPGLEAENESKPALAHEMETNSSFNATHSAEKVVGKMLGWIPKGKFLGYATWDSWFQYSAARHIPNTTLMIADMEMRQAQKRLLEGGVKQINLPKGEQ